MIFLYIIACTCTHIEYSLFCANKDEEAPDLELYAQEVGDCTKYCDRQRSCVWCPIVSSALGPMCRVQQGALRRYCIKVQRTCGKVTFKETKVVTQRDGSRPELITYLGRIYELYMNQKHDLYAKPMPGIPFVQLSNYPRFSRTCFGPLLLSVQ